LKLTETQQRYSTYDRELLAVYLSIKYFRGMLEGRPFEVRTDHKPLIYAFRQKYDRASPRKLDFISQFTTNITHVAGIENTIARYHENTIFSELSRTLGITHLRTTSYHPQANSIIELLLGLRTAFKLDIGTTAAQLVYGTTLRLPGQFFTETKTPRPQSEFVKQLTDIMEEIRPIQNANHDTSKKFVSSKLMDASYVFVRNDKLRPAFQPPYDGPYQVVSKNQKYFNIKMSKNEQRQRIDRPTEAGIY
ncbi:uncharacterized protein LOC118752384, partial [Rhagoletis pomonella]|uniref:uncharacterized protein LOC118752384 n=1 Tax=Rhagoletis pomonella TaxID=28610 RepID=UPI0017874E2C